MRGRFLFFIYFVDKAADGLYSGVYTTPNTYVFTRTSAHLVAVCSQPLHTLLPRFSEWLTDEREIFIYLFIYCFWWLFFMLKLRMACTTPRFYAHAERSFSGCLFLAIAHIAPPSQSAVGLYFCSWLAKLAVFLAAVPLAKYGAWHPGCRQTREALLHG